MVSMMLPTNFSVALSERSDIFYVL
uniref:Uncharacterized protein n=1 Tax=Arundo donax TaxID=35708 RepID=A0A0A9B995_ARUDO